jgi:cyclase
MNRRDFLLTTSGALAAGLLPRSSLLAQTPAASPAPTATPAPLMPVFEPVRRNVGFFTCRGGTIGSLVNSGGVAAVDTQFPDTAKLFLDGLPGRNGRKIDVLINSHHHGDHTGGNKVFQPETIIIAAQENVPALQKAAAVLNKSEADQVYASTLFAKEWKTEVGDEVIHATYFGPAHTNGDAIIHFEKADVVHMGDLVFNRLYPVIDRRSGASIKNWIVILEKISKMFGPDTIFIFGHGKPEFGVIGKTADFLLLRDYFTALLAYTAKEMAAGKKREEIAGGIENFPGFPDLHGPKPNRLANNLEVAFDELSAG